MPTNELDALAKRCVEFNMSRSDVTRYNVDVANGSCAKCIFLELSTPRRDVKWPLWRWVSV